MTPTPAIVAARAARTRRSLAWAGIEIPLLLSYLVAVGADLGDGDRPWYALVFLAYAVAGGVRPLVVDGNDELQRLRVLRRFALAAAAGVAVLVTQVVRLSVDPRYSADPVLALEIVALVWVVINVVTGWQERDRQAPG